MNFLRISMRRKQQQQQFFLLLFILLGCAILNVNRVSVFAFVVQPILTPSCTSYIGGNDDDAGTRNGDGNGRRQIQISAPSSAASTTTTTFTKKTAFYRPPTIEIDSPLSSSRLFMNRNGNTLTLDKSSSLSSSSSSSSTSRLFHCSHLPAPSLQLQQHLNHNNNNNNNNNNNRRKKLSLLNGSVSPDSNNTDDENNFKALIYNLYKLTFARLWNTWFFRLLRGIKARLFKGKKDEDSAAVDDAVGQKEEKTKTQQLDDKSNDSNKVLLSEQYIQDVMNTVEKKDDGVGVPAAAAATAATAAAVTTSEVVVTKSDSAIEEENEVVVEEGKANEEEEGKANEEEEEEENVVVPVEEAIGEKVDGVKLEAVSADVATTMELSEEAEVLAEDPSPAVAVIEKEATVAATTASTTLAQDEKVEETKVEEEVSSEPTTVEATESIIKPVIDDIEQIEKDIAIVEQSSRSSIKIKDDVDETSASQELGLLPRGNRWAISAPDIDLSATWKIVVSDEFKKDYDEYLKNLGQPSIVRSIAVSIVELTTEEVIQSDMGRSLSIKGKNLRGVWERTLVASGSDYDNHFDEKNEEHEFVDLITADKEKVKAEAWWENNGTVHRSYLRGGKKYGGGDFESKRYLEDDGNTLICESVFHPKEGKEPAVIKWTFTRAG